MLALLLRLALATIRNSREIIITDAVGAPFPPSKHSLASSTGATETETGGGPSDAVRAAGMPN